MKKLVLAWNPNHIKQEDVEKLVGEMRIAGIEVHTILHYKQDTLPIYSVQWILTDDKKDERISGS